MRTEARFPGVGRGRRALRELLHQGDPARRRPGRLDPPHGPQAPRRASPPPRSGSRCSTPTRRARGRPRPPSGAERLGARRAPTSRSTARVLEPGRARGELEHRRARGELGPGFESGPEAFHHLPYAFLYGAPLPRTKFLSPYPDARFSGDGDGRRRADRARRLAGDDRPQLGRRARRALGLDPGERVARRRRATSTPRSAGSRSAR